LKLDICENDKISNILVLTHGNWGEELIKSAKMIAGGFENVSAVALNPKDTFNDYLIKVKKTLSAFSGKTLVIADLFGGTPSNIAALLSREYDIEALSGLSLSMLIEAIFTKDNINSVQLVEEVLNAGKDNCKDIIKMISKNKNLSK
jgi:mannose/fructose-specific phosphotransferase system component IIA